MDIGDFFNSWQGMYLAQMFLHSLVAAIIVDTALLAWSIENPLVRLRFRLLVLLLPPVLFPVYQAIDPERGSAVSRLHALFDINRWLDLEFWGTVQLGVLFLLVLLFTTALFLFQELLPIVHHTASRGEDDHEATEAEPGSPVSVALAGLPGVQATVFIMEDDEAAVFSSTGRDPSVFLSTGLIRLLNARELRAVLAHEIGHIRRSRRPFMVLVFLLRVAMFFNPVILMEFRRLVQEEEKICDDVAVALTGDRAALAAALRKFYDAETGGQPARHGDGARMRDRIEEYSHSLLMESRIARLEETPALEANRAIVFGVVLTTIVVISYYIV